MAFKLTSEFFSDLLLMLGSIDESLLQLELMLPLQLSALVKVLFHVQFLYPEYLYFPLRIIIDTVRQRLLP
jgi:hypothetical protein